MSQIRLIRASLGVVGICLLSLVLVRSWAAGQAAIFADDASEGSSEVYLPLVTKLLVFGPVSRVSVASDGTEGSDHSFAPSISADGRFIAFASWASNLVSNDMNGTLDVFVHDRQTGETNRVSVASDGTEGNDLSESPSISADGRYVVFYSRANNLVGDDNNYGDDIFVHDRQTGETRLISVASDGTRGNYSSLFPSISPDGRYVVFYSGASNLVSGDTNNYYDVFVHDRQTAETSRVSVTSNGTQADGSSTYPSISADGRFVVFQSNADNLANGDTNIYDDVFVHDRQTGETSYVSVSSNGVGGNNHSGGASISADGRYVIFSSVAGNLVEGDTNAVSDAFIHDRQTGQTDRVSVATDGMQLEYNSGAHSISGDGRYVIFTSSFYYDLWIYLHDRQLGVTYPVPLVTDELGANVLSTLAPAAPILPIASMTPDGRFIVFTSDDSTLVNDDTNEVIDVFVQDRDD